MESSASENKNPSSSVLALPQAAKVLPSTGALLTRSFLLVGALILMGGVIAVWQIRVMQERAQRLYEVEQPALAILRTHSDFQRFQAELQSVSETHDASRFAAKANSLRSAFTDDIERARRAIQHLPPGSERNKQSSGLEAIRTLFSSQMDSLMDLAAASDWNGVQLRVQSRGPVIAALSEALVSDIDALVVAGKKQELMEIQQAGRRAVLTLLSIGLVTLLIAGILGWNVTRVIGGRLEQLDLAAHALGRGEFQYRVQVGGRDEIGRLARVFNEMSGKLSDLYEALHHSEAQFRSLIENASDFILMLAPGGIVRYASPSFERVAGGDQSVLGKSLLELVEEGDRMGVKELVAAAQAHRSPHIAQFRIRRHDGGLRLLEASASDLLENSAVKAIVVNARDVTDRRLLEEQLIRAQRMEAIGTLSGGIAHDFNNLLTVILGHAEQLLQETENAPVLQNQLKRIDEAGRRAATLTRQLLAFSRKQVLQPRVFNMNSLIVDLDKMLRRLIGENIELVTVTDPQLGCVRADPAQIEQVVMNLVVNARDAMKKGGKLVIETANVDLDDNYARERVGLVSGPNVMLAISDTGEGIPPEIMPHIFEPFFTTKDVGQGTGLGLSMVYGIVKQSGGHIWVYSEPGRGTTFKVYFPTVHERAEVASQPANTPAVVSGDETVLVVEDEPALRELIQTVLLDRGFSVLAAPNPAEAIAISRTQAKVLHLLLTDVVLPGMSGRDLAQQLRLERPDMKVLYMSGYASHFITHQGALDPGTRLLEKPFHPQMLLTRVREVLDMANGNQAT